MPTEERRMTMDKCKACGREYCGDRMNNVVIGQHFGGVLCDDCRNKAFKQFIAARGDEKPKAPTLEERVEIEMHACADDADKQNNGDYQRGALDAFAYIGNRLQTLKEEFQQVFISREIADLSYEIDVNDVAVSTIGTSVSLEHVPTGISVKSTDGESTHANRVKAFGMLISAIKASIVDKL
jgi:hypothetical protein